MQALATISFCGLKTTEPTGPTWPGHVATRWPFPPPPGLKDAIYLSGGDAAAHLVIVRGRGCLVELGF